MDESCKCCAGLIRHERELRESQTASLAAELKRHDAETERRLGLLNGEYARIDAERMRSVSLEKFEAHMRAGDVRYEFLRQQIQDEQQARIRIETVAATLRVLVVLVGSPGVIALLWALIAAAANRTVTGPNGLLP